MTRAACAGRSLGRTISAGLQPRHQTREIVCRKVIPAHHEIGTNRDKGDWFKIFQDVVRKRVDCSINNVRSPVAQAKSVSIGCAPRGPAMSDATRSSAIIFYDDGLA